MDRRIVYPGQILLDADLLAMQKYALKGLAGLSGAVLGAGPYVDGLGCIPTSPTSLTLQVLAGTMFTSGVVDQNGFSTLGTDSHVLTREGILEDTQSFTFTPPGTSGYAVNYIVQASIGDVDVNPLVLAYFNAANPAAPFLGPNNSGDSQPTRRQCKLNLSIKQGTAALAGTQTDPTPDAGFTALYRVTVAYGATTLDTTAITQLSAAPFINPKLPAVPKASQAGTWNYAVAGGTANAITATLNPAPDALVPGFPVRLKIAANNTAATSLNVNGFGAVSVKKPSGSTLSGGELVAGSIVELIFDGSVWFLQTAQATATSTSTGGLTTIATTDPITGDGTGGSPVAIRAGSKTQNGAWRGATVAEFNAGNAAVVVTPDLLAGMGASSPIITNIKNVLGVSGIEIIDKTVVYGDPNSYTFDVSNYALFCIQFGNVDAYNHEFGFVGAAPTNINVALMTDPNFQDGCTAIFCRTVKGSRYGDSGWMTLPDAQGNFTYFTGNLNTCFIRASQGFMRLIGVRKLVL